MKKVFKKIISAILVTIVFITIIPMTAFMASGKSYLNKTVVLSEYISTGSRKIAGKDTGGSIELRATKSNGMTGKAIFKDIVLSVFGTNAVTGSTCPKSADFYIYKTKSGRGIEFKINEHGVKYKIIGVVHFKNNDNSNFSNIVKIDSLDIPKYQKRMFEIDNRTYFKIQTKNSSDISDDLSSSKADKPGTYVAKNNITLRTGPGYNYPEATGSISTNSVDAGSILSDDIISTASVQSNSTMVSTNSVASIIKKNEVIGITKIQNGWGYTTYKGISGWLNLRYCSYQGTLITKPQPPVMKLLTSPDIPATGTITVSWDSVYDAKYYKAVLFNSAGAEVKSYGNLYGTSATFTPQDEGVYTVKVYAQNSMYTSDPGVLAQAITVHGKSKVTYYDDDGKTVLGTQEVSYTNSSTAPIAPEKEGYSFYGWVDINDNSGEAENTKTVSLENIKAEKSVKAKYTKNKYQVMFLDNKGNQIGSTQSVPYMESAIPPEPPALDGYLFAGWSSDDYKNVYRLNKSDIIKIYPVYVWENKEIPVTCTITEASRRILRYF